MHLTPRAFLLAAFALGAAVVAQRPSAWVPLNLTAPLNPASIRSLGKVQAYLDQNNKINFFSAFTHEWKQAQVTSPLASVRTFNDIGFVVDTGQILAFSAYRGTIEVLPISASASLVNPSTQTNDSILGVVDGGTLWTFSCFRGVWTSRPIGASPRIATQRHTMVVAEGATLHGMSAFFGTWVSILASGPELAASANGSWGVVETATELYGFSAQRNAWTSTPVLSGSVQNLKNEDCCVYWNDTTAVAYSGLRGAFAGTRIAAGASVAIEALVVVVQDASNLALYSAVLGTWTAFTSNGTAALAVRPHMVTWNAGGIVSAFSPFLGTVATMPVGTQLDASNQGVAVAVDLLSSRLHLFSTLTGAWVTAPQDAVIALPNLIWCGALVRTATGYLAYSGRTGRFIPLATSAMAVPHTDSNSSVIALEDGNRLHVYEPRRETWLSINKVNPGPLNVRIWRTTLLAVDGATVHGYGALAGTIESHNLPAPPVELNANSESLRAGGGSTLVAFGGTSDFTTLYQFPEFRRVYASGSVVEAQLHAAPGSVAVALLGLIAPAPISLPPYGELFLNPTSFAVIPIGVLPGDGRGLLVLYVPDVPALRGLELAFQGVVAPPAGVASLTRLATVRLQ